MLNHKIIPQNLLTQELTPPLHPNAPLSLPPLLGPTEAPERSRALPLRARVKLCGFVPNLQVAIAHDSHLPAQSLGIIPVSVGLVHFDFNCGRTRVVRIDERGVEFGMCGLAGLEGRPGCGGDGVVSFDEA